MPRRSHLDSKRAIAGIIWRWCTILMWPAFIDMMTSQDYETHCDPHRTNGCAEHVIIATREAYSKFKIP